MIHLYRIKKKAAVGYLDSPNDSFGRGDNVMFDFFFSVAPDADEKNQSTLKSVCRGVIHQLDHKHLHLEVPEWREASEQIHYGLDRVLQATVYQLKTQGQAWESLLRLDVLTGSGALRSFEKKAEFFA